MSRFTEPPGRGSKNDQLSHQMFWIAHLAGWKRAGKAPAPYELTNLFTGKDPLSGGLRSDFKNALETIRWTLQNGKCIFIEAESEQDVFFEGSESKPVSEYIVLCNYRIISKHCGARREQLKQIIQNFITNIHDAERNRYERGANSLFPDKEKEIVNLCCCLNEILQAYDHPDAGIGKKDWLISRALSWLLIGSTLRDKLSMDLIEDCLKRYLLDTDLKGNAEENLSTDILIDNFQENEDIVYGREEQIREIRSLFDSQRNEPGRSRIVYIQGIGGIGKSTLAKEYAKKYIQVYSTIIEVSASSAKEAVMMMGTTIPESVQYQARIQRIASACRKRSVLLIVHDYNQPQDETYGDWNRLGCDILLTGWHDRRPMRIKTIQLETNNESDEAALTSAADIFCANYLKNAVDDDNERWKNKLQQLLYEDQESVRELCAMTGCHPLTIKVLAMQSACTPGKEERPRELLRKLHVQQIEHAPAKAFGISKDGYSHQFGDALTHLENVFASAVRNNSFSDEEYRCLRYMILVPYTWGICASRFEEWTGEDANWLSLLRQKGWIEYDRAKPDVLSGSDYEGTYRMPMAIASSLTGMDKITSDIMNCARYINNLVSKNMDEESDYARREALAASLEALLLRIREEDSVNYSSIITHCALLIHGMGTNKHRWHFAWKILNKALEIRRRILGEDHPYTALSYNNIGFSFWNLGEREKGLEYQEKALEIQRRILGENYPDTATSYNNIGFSYWNLGEREKGLEYLEKALEIRQQVLGEDHPDTAKSYNNVGMIYNDLGARKKGLEYIEKALEIQQRVLGEDHPNIALAYNNAGLSFWNLGDREKGLKCLEKALEIRQKVLGEDHPDTAMSYNNVGLYCWNLGDREKGLEYLEKGLEIRRRVLDENHLDTAMSYNNVGSIYENLGEREKGLKYKEKALEIQQRVLGEEHADTASSYNNIGSSYWDLGDREKGLEYLEMALEIRRRVLGEDHPDTAMSYDNVGVSYKDLGDRKKGLENMEKALDIRKRVLGEELPDTATSYNNVGSSYWDLGDREKGLEYKEKALEIRRRILGEDHLNTAMSYNNVGFSYKDLGNLEKGVKYLEKALEIRRRVLGEDHPDTAISYNNVGISYKDLGDWKKGLEYLEKALEIQRRILGEEFPDTATSYNNVGSSYLDLGEYEKGLEYQEKALEIRRRVLGEDHPDTAKSYNSVGMSYDNIGKRDKGLEYQEKALEIRRRVLSEDHPDTASSYNNVGLSYWTLGDRKKGLKCLEKALDIQRRILGENHPDTATFYNNIGFCYRVLGKRKNGLEYQEKALEIRRKVLGEDHPDTAASYNNIGWSYAEMGEYKTALSMMANAYSIRARLFGEEDPLTIKFKKCIEVYKEKLKN